MSERFTRGFSMKGQFLLGAAAGAIVAGLASSAHAAPPPPVPYLWTGLYIGGHVAWVKPDFSGTWFGDSGNTDFAHRPSGFAAGLTAGQNWQHDMFVFGWEGDVTFMNLKRTSYFSGGLAESGDMLTTQLNLLASLRARLGLTVLPNTLLFVTGGLAYADASVKGMDLVAPLSGDLSGFGAVIGGGAEYLINPNWSVSVEGLYYAFNKSVTLVGPSDSAIANLNDVILVRGGINYHFPPL